MVGGGVRCRCGNSCQDSSRGKSRLHDAEGRRGCARPRAPMPDTAGRLDSYLCKIKIELALHQIDRSIQGDGEDRSRDENTSRGQEMNSNGIKKRKEKTALRRVLPFFSGGLLHESCTTRTAHKHTKISKMRRAACAFRPAPRHSLCAAVLSSPAVGRTLATVTRNARP